MLRTAIPNLLLRELDTTDAAQLFRLVRENAQHLTAHGDYGEMVSRSLDDMRQELANESKKHLPFGLLFEDRLVGRLDLIPVEPSRYSIGYWLAKDQTGHGYATAAIKAVSNYAVNQLGASDLYAGVTHGNAKSVAALERAGFHKVADFEHYARFHLPLPVA